MLEQVSEFFDKILTEFAISDEFSPEPEGNCEINFGARCAFQVRVNTRVCAPFWEFQDSKRELAVQISRAPGAHA